MTIASIDGPEDREPAQPRIVVDEVKMKWLETCAKDARGLRLNGSNDGVAWIGRVGYRVELAHAIRDLYREKHRDLPDEGARYLAELVSCGMLHHLMQAAGKSGGEAALHLEAALFLLQEQQELKPELLNELKIVRAQWDQTISRVLTSRVMTNPDPAAGSAPTPSRYARICLPVLRAVTLLHERSRTEACQPWPEMQQSWLDMNESLAWAISHPHFEKQADPEPTAAWQGFLADISRFLGRVLARCDIGVARQLLQARLAQDWHGLPPPYRELLRAQLPRLGPQYAEHVARRAASRAMLMEYLADLAMKPALAVFLLATLASTEVRYRQRAGAIEEPKAQEILGLVADAALRLGRSAGFDGSIEDLEPSVESPEPPVEDPWEPIRLPPGSPAGSAALDLVQDAGLLARLCEEFAGANGKRRRLDEGSGQLEHEIEGIALGAHGQSYALVRLLHA